MLGDARVSLERELREKGAGGFDVLAIDAFSGDAIPVHLLTKEAVELYFRHLRPDGVLALHISNRHVDLLPVVKAIATSLGLARTVVDTEYDDQPVDTVTWESTWVLLARTPSVLAPFGPTDEEADVRQIRPWTDEYSNLIQLLKR